MIYIFICFNSRILEESWYSILIPELFRKRKENGYSIFIPELFAPRVFSTHSTVCGTRLRHRSKLDDCQSKDRQERLRDLMIGSFFDSSTRHNFLGVAGETELKR